MLKHFSSRTQLYPLKIIPRDLQLNKFPGRYYVANANKPGNYRGLFPSFLFFATFVYPSDSSPIEGESILATNYASFLALLPPLQDTLSQDNCGRIYF
jgi:hypothetical protein